MQLFQLFLPVGEAFNPILDKILGGMSFVKSKKLREIALNEQTTGLVNYMRDTAGYKGLISITGHSLGGGIAMITVSVLNSILISELFIFYVIAIPFYHSFIVYLKKCICHFKKGAETNIPTVAISGKSHFDYFVS